MCVCRRRFNLTPAHGAEAFPLPLWFRHGDGGVRPTGDRLRMLLMGMGVLLKLTTAGEPGHLKVRAGALLVALWCMAVQRTSSGACGTRHHARCPGGGAADPRGHLAYLHWPGSRGCGLCGGIVCGVLCA